MMHLLVQIKIAQRSMRLTIRELTAAFFPLMEFQRYSGFPPPPAPPLPPIHMWAKMWRP